MCQYCGKGGPRTPIAGGWAHKKCVPLTPSDLKLESEIQADCVETYRRLGLKVYVFSQHRLGSGTQQTPGIADLKVCCVRKRVSWWHEVKTPSGKQEPEQLEFQRDVEACGGTYILGGPEAMMEQLRAVGLIARPARTSG